MIGARSLAKRIGSAAEAVAAFTPTFREDATVAISKIDDKIEDARGRRTVLVAERDAAVIASVEGDTSSTKKADALDGQIADIDRELERYSIARKSASDRAAVETRTAREKRQREHRAAIRAKVKDLKAAAADADEIAGKLAAALQKVAGLTVELRLLAKSDELSDVLAGLDTCVPFFINDRLAQNTKYLFKPLPFSDKAAPDRSCIANKVPDEGYVVALAGGEA